MIMFVCPKCNRQLMSIHGLTKKCEFCRTQMIETTYDEEKVDMTLEELNEVIFNEYVKDNPLYDPEEAKRTDKIQSQQYQEYLDCQAKLHSQQMQQQNKPHCPYCNSIDLSKIGTVKRGLSVFAFGLASGKIGKQWHCNKCNSDF